MPDAPQSTQTDTVASQQCMLLTESNTHTYSLHTHVFSSTQKAREDKDASMRDYCENRKFALRVRDMVAAGQQEDARLLAVAQVCFACAC